MTTGAGWLKSTQLVMAMAAAVIVAACGSSSSTATLLRRTTADVAGVRALIADFSHASVNGPGSAVCATFTPALRRQTMTDYA